MGKRVLYEIMGEIDDEKKPVCILYSNSSHGGYDLDETFQQSVDASAGPTALVEHLLSMRYTSSAANHREGDRIFNIVTTPYSDWEYALTVDFDADQPKEVSRRDWSNEWKQKI